MQISREHFMIDHFEGEYFLIDRGSSLGTLVNGTRVGGNRQKGQIALHNGDLITVGNERSKYIFRFEVS
jgi:pSer/pThr/pTyr-binding forkhead associated (FHA) protein